MTTRDHFITSQHYPPVYGDRPEPWQTCYQCGCGAELGEDEEGRGSLDVEAEFEAHLAEEGAA